MNLLTLKTVVTNALLEDLGMGDLTSQTIFTVDAFGKGTFKAKKTGVISGIQVADVVYAEFPGEKVTFTAHVNDGDSVQAGDIIAEAEGPVRTLLSGERVILNLMQHLSGIATATREMVDLLDDESIIITDTRKTLPGLRNLQKYAVTCGGGRNHRFRLDDGVMIKDNHIKAAGSITEAVQKVRSSIGHMVKIEVETESREQVLEAVQAGADVIMLDNRSPRQVAEWVQLIPDGIISEVSGGITPENIAGYKGCGADVISVGWLTHSVQALDISFNLD